MAPTFTDGDIDSANPPIRFRYVTAAQYLVERLRDLSGADPLDPATFDVLHDQAVMAMADLGDVKDVGDVGPDTLDAAPMSAPLRRS
jgi:hypothetical protein